MLSQIYATIYKAAVLAMPLISQPQPADLASMLVSNANNPIIQVQQQNKTTLESFLSVQYSKEKYSGILELDTIKPVEEVEHFHISKMILERDGQRIIDEQRYIESVIVYLTVKTSKGKTVHLLSDYKPNSKTPEYMVVLPEGENKAYVVDPDNLFDKQHLIEKIRIHLGHIKEERF